MDGLELQARLLQLGIALPVIVMTGQGDVHSAVRAMKAGAVDFIEKPYNDEALLSAIEAALARAGRRDQDREAAEAKRADCRAQPARASGSRRVDGGTPKQGDRVRPRHQRAHGRGPSRPHDGAARGPSAGRGDPHRGDGAISQLIGSLDSFAKTASNTPAPDSWGLHRENRSFALWKLLTRYAAQKGTKWLIIGDAEQLLRKERLHCNERAPHEPRFFPISELPPSIPT